LEIVSSRLASDALVLVYEVKGASFDETHLQCHAGRKITKVFQFKPNF
jgi:hypothetical protein